MDTKQNYSVSLVPIFTIGQFCVWSPLVTWTCIFQVQIHNTKTLSLYILDPFKSLCSSTAVNRVCCSWGTPDSKTPQYLLFIQTHPLGSISALTLTGGSQDTLCNCWSKVGRNRSRLKKKREREYEKLLTVSWTDHCYSQKSSEDHLCAGASIYFNGLYFNRKRKWKL